MANGRKPDMISAGLSFSQHLSRNNFDLLRFLFAGTVCLVHASRFSGYPQLAFIGHILESAWAVKAFFVVSGFLIFMSFERSASIYSYAGNRFRRIYPAYVTIVMLCALGLVFVSTKSVADYFSVAWLKYVISNLLFLNFLQLAPPGVFEANIDHAVNGSLWTLKIEVMFYLMVPVFIYFFRRFSPLLVMLLTYFLSLSYASLLIELARDTHVKLYFELSRQLPGQLSYFMAGAFFYYYFHWFERWVGYFMLGAVLVFAVRVFYPVHLLEPFALATIVIFFGMFLYAGNFGKYGDFSYGLYIIHFPILQVLVWSTWFQGSPWYFLIVLICTSLLGSIVMWHLVEKRFLLRNNHYIAVEKAQLK